MARAGQGEIIHFDIPSGDAVDTLKQAARSGGVQVVFIVSAVDGVKTNPIHGRFRVSDALDHMVANTGLSVVWNAKAAAAFSIERVPAQPNKKTNPAPKNSPDPKTNTMKTRSLLPTVAGLFAFISSVEAQTLNKTPTPASKNEETLILSPFEVNTVKDTGYGSANSLAGGRTSTPLALTPSSISVITKELMNDLNITSAEQAAGWTVNANVNNEQPSVLGLGRSDVRLRNAGAGSTRNYFLYYSLADAFDTERLEYSRGPNSMLFGDGPVGGAFTTFTKVAKYQQIKNSVRVDTSTFGGYRATLDSNYGADNYAIRVNLLNQDVDGWRNGAWEKRNGAHLTTSFKLGSKSQLRVEGEVLQLKMPTFSTNYTDNASFWDKTTINSTGIITLPTGETLANRGLGTISGNPYFVYTPGNPTAGVQDWRTSYQTNGTGTRINPDGNPGVPNIPSLPSRKFTVAGNNMFMKQSTRNLALYLDRQITPNWFAQLAYFYFTQDARTENGQLFGNNARPDINQVLPDGRPNPKFGKFYSDASQSKQTQKNEVGDLRLLTTYKFEVPKAFDWKQRLTLILDDRIEKFRLRAYTFGRVDNPAIPNATNAANTVRYRFYWDEPLNYGFLNTSPVPGWKMDWVNSAFSSLQDKPLRSASLSSNSTFFGDRLSVVGGVRHDSAANNQLFSVASEPDGSTILGGFDPVTRANRIGAISRDEANVTSTQVGAVYFVTPWLGLTAGRSSTFSLIGAGNPKLDQRSFNAPYSEGQDVGIRFNLPNGKLYSTITRYQSSDKDTIIGDNGTATNFRTVWTNLGSTNPDQTGLAFRDLASTDYKGWEFEVVANPLRNLRLTANYALPQRMLVTQNVGAFAYYNANLASWNTQKATRSPSEIVNIDNALLNLKNFFDGIQTGVMANNTYKGTGSIYATYDFKGGVAKGFSVGAGGQYRGKRKISNIIPQILYNLPVGTNPTVQQTRDAAFAYRYDKSNFVAQAHVAYQIKITRKVSAKFQLTVSNLFNNQDVVVVNYQSYAPVVRAGQPATQVTQTIGDFYYRDPIKFSLSSTFDF